MRCLQMLTMAILVVGVAAMADEEVSSGHGHVTLVGTLVLGFVLLLQGAIGNAAEGAFSRAATRALTTLPVSQVRVRRGAWVVDTFAATAGVLCVGFPILLLAPYTWQVKWIAFSTVMLSASIALLLQSTSVGLIRTKVWSGPGDFRGVLSSWLLLVLPLAAAGLLYRAYVLHEAAAWNAGNLMILGAILLTSLYAYAQMQWEAVAVAKTQKQLQAAPQRFASRTGLHTQRMLSSLGLGATFAVMAVFVAYAMTRMHFSLGGVFGGCIGMGTGMSQLLGERARALRTLPLSSQQLFTDVLVQGYYMAVPSALTVPCCIYFGMMAVPEQHATWHERLLETLSITQSQVTFGLFDYVLVALVSLLFIMTLNLLSTLIFEHLVVYLIAFLCFAVTAAVLYGAVGRLATTFPLLISLLFTGVCFAALVIVEQHRLIWQPTLYRMRIVNGKAVTQFAGSDKATLVLFGGLALFAIGFAVITHSKLFLTQ